MSMSPVIQSEVEIAEHCMGRAGDARRADRGGNWRTVHLVNERKPSGASIELYRAVLGGLLGRGCRPQRRTSRTLLPVDRRRALAALVYRGDSQRKSVWRARRPQMPVDANREMVALVLLATAVATTIGRYRMLFSWPGGWLLESR